jgi:hypothetical protein
MNLVVSVSISTRLQSVASLLGNLTELQQAAGYEVQQVTVAHVSVLASTRHATAQKLGASPTNHFAQAAEKVAAPAALSADADGATLTINHPGFSRAFRSVKIAPRTAKALALPIHPAAYGHKASELWDRMGLFIPKGKRIIAATIGGVMTPFYVLVGSVTQKQDRSLLPSDEQFQAAARIGVTGWLRMALSKGGKL